MFLHRLGVSAGLVAELTLRGGDFTIRFHNKHTEAAEKHNESAESCEARQKHGARCCSCDIPAGFSGLEFAGCSVATCSPFTHKHQRRSGRPAPRDALYLHTKFPAEVHKSARRATYSL